MFSFSMPELILILVIALVVFGPGKLPEVGKALGRSLQEFKKATTSLTETAKEESAKIEAVKVDALKVEAKPVESSVEQKTSEKK